MKFVLMCTALFIAACANVPGVYDQSGHSQAQYQQDLAYCQANAPLIGWGNPITNCMRKKGYTVLWHG